MGLEEVVEMVDLGSDVVVRAGYEWLFGNF
jgi:hypothetical protein